MVRSKTLLEIARAEVRELKTALKALRVTHKSEIKKAFIAGLIAGSGGEDAFSAEQAELMYEMFIDKKPQGRDAK